jgi:hypothetical protein
LRLGISGRSSVVGVVRIAIGGVVWHASRGVVRVAARGVGGGVGSAHVLFVVDSLELDPLDFLHVGVPDVFSGMASLDGGRSERADVCKNYQGSISAKPTQLNVWYRTYGLSR